MDNVIAFPGCSEDLCYYLAKGSWEYIKMRLKDDDRISDIIMDYVYGRNLPVFDAQGIIVIDDNKHYRSNKRRVMLRCCMMPEDLYYNVRTALYRKRGVYLLTIVYQNREFSGNKGFAALITPWGSKSQF